MEYNCSMVCVSAVQGSEPAIFILSCIWFFGTPWAVAIQAPVSMEFSRQEILEWVTIPFSRGSSPPRDQTCVSFISCIGHLHNLGISYMYTYIPSLMSLPPIPTPHPTPQGHHRVLNSAPVLYSSFPIASYFIHSSIYTGEGNGTPLQYSCLENPMNGGAW